MRARMRRATTMTATRRRSRRRVRKRRRQYRVRWTVEPQVPVKYAEPEWMLRRQFVNPDLVDAFEQRLRAVPGTW